MKVKCMKNESEMYEKLSEMYEKLTLNRASRQLLIPNCKTSISLELIMIKSKS